jgi:protein subunit release factor A
MKEKLFTLTKKDFTIQTFRSGGKGGQHQNKTDSGVRIIHNDSGARGECRNHREQSRNKKVAMQRLSNSKEFRIWINRKAQEVIEGKRLEDKVEEQMNPENLKIEVKGKGGRWEKGIDYA